MSIAKDKIFVEKLGKPVFYMDEYIKYVTDNILLSEELTRQLLLGTIIWGNTDFEFTYKDDIGIIHESKLSFYSNTYTNRHELKNNYIEYQDYCIKLDTLWVDAEFLMYDLRTLNYSNYINHYKYNIIVTTVKDDYPVPLTLNMYNIGVSQYDLQVDLSKYFEKDLYIHKEDILMKYIQWNLVNDANIVCNVSYKTHNFEPYVYLYENNRKKVEIYINADYSDSKIDFLSDFVDSFSHKVKGDNFFIITIDTKNIFKKNVVITKRCHNLITNLYNNFDKVILCNTVFPY